MKKDNISKNMWKRHFDSIFCLNYAPNVKRRNDAIRRFKALGILPNDNFFWTLNFKSPSEHILFDITKSLRANECINLIEFNIMMGHYRMIKSAYETGSRKSLFLEDDNCFLKDVEFISKAIDNSPESYDVVSYAYIILGENEKEIYTNPTENAVNEFYYDVESKNVGKIWGAGMYSLSRNAMEKFINVYESRSVVSDFFYSYFSSNELKICRSAKNLAIQVDDSVATHKELNVRYENMGCNIDDYDTSES